jgi:glycine cleavage system transcriptional repressor
MSSGCGAEVRMATEYFVMTAVGPDRPGLMNAISDYVFARGGNVQSSRAATLGGEFAVVLLVLVEESAAATLENQVNELGRAGLSCTIRRTSAPRLPAAGGGQCYTLAVDAIDHPGIIHAITHDLATMSVNIESLDTQVDSAPHTGTTLFHFRARVTLPPGLKPVTCRKKLSGLARRFNFDLSLTAEDQASAAE